MVFEVPSTLLFRGKRYHLFYVAESRREALREATRLRKNNYNATTFRGKGYIAVYSYPKTPHWYNVLFLKKKEKEEANKVSLIGFGTLSRERGEQGNRHIGGCQRRLQSRMEHRSGIGKQVTSPPAG